MYFVALLMSVTLITGDCRETMAAMQPASIDAIVCDPPYHLTQASRGGSARSNPGNGPASRHRVGETGFMGKTWDGGDVAMDPATWAACYRVLKPGGRLLAFGAPRTAHRIWCAIEDGGFLIEDTVMWVFGSGFPKHRSKLKPAYEPVCVARKDNASELNIDGCRIAADDAAAYGRNCSGDRGHAGTRDSGAVTDIRAGGGSANDAGRWPANVILDEESGAALDEQSGVLTSGGTPPTRIADKFGSTYGTFKGAPVEEGIGRSSGGASRFFYVAKASRAEREFGLHDIEKQPGGAHRHGTSSIGSKEGRDRPVGNHHPTVKPVDLMRYLVRLVTPDGGTVLDPFMGSGTTGIACVLEGRDFIGCELSPEYTEIARLRIAHAQPSLFTREG